MLAARNRMRRSVEFAATIKHGRRSAHPDLVIHAHRAGAPDSPPGPRIGLVVSKAVGTAVTRHRVSRRLRHVARTVVDELDPADRVVIRARPGCAVSSSAALETQLRAGLTRLTAGCRSRR
ncbi:ribonuclease P protein component [Mycolicibacillus parakoreensis]|uniref:Ribonuclease P protein component n=2 Tax=Mycobacteriaceae TaxID=1762 RepID=A0ABY3U1T0_9MYCO|nr:ribonuclease P protein component [Mycolicibacillus parakoreensis]MCV7316616.1 ribonuclease P protein component [Mycolicibacillus parakoreensis]ULN52828.1 ribonuclease P protein component [Mycolicibacillus parakoreensis]